MLPASDSNRENIPGSRGKQLENVLVARLLRATYTYVCEPKCHEFALAPMKTLSIQLLPDRLEIANVADLVSLLSNTGKELGALVTVSEGKDRVRYVNINFEHEDLARLWQALKPKIEGRRSLSHSTSVVCEGNNSWDDYLLLHHYDSTVVLDKIPDNNSEI